MTTKSIPMRCVPKRMHRITVISRSRILVPIVISDEWLAEIKARQPELRTEKLERYKKEYESAGL